MRYFAYLSIAGTYLLSAFVFVDVARAQDTLSHNTHTLTHTLELKPMPYKSFQLAKTTFLPNRFEDLGLSGYDTIDIDFGDSSCSDYKLSSCPTGGVCSKCPTDASKLKLKSCNSPYTIKDNSCTCPATVSLVYANDKCTLYCNSKCIKKTCTPNANKTNCTNGTKSCDNGCGSSTAKCCVACANKVTTKPSNSSYTYSSCTDNSGTKQIQTGWKCNTGYHEKSSACEKDCITNNCSGYTLSACPAGYTCSSCTKTASNCSTSGTYYKISGCPTNTKDTNTYWCSVPKSIDCATLGYKRSSGSCGSLVQLACPFDTSKVACIDFE